MRAPFVKNTLAGKIFDVCNIIIMLIMMFVMIYPFWNQFIVSLNEGKDGQRGGLYWWPRKFTLENYAYIFESEGLVKNTLMSVARVVVGTTTTLACSGLIAYITTVPWFSANRTVRRIFIISMYFSAGLIPTYLWYLKLGLVETFTVYWLPGLVSSYYMMILASYMFGLPEALAESARIDGAIEIVIYIRVIAPLCLPVFAALAVMAAVGHWNAWFDVMIYNPSGKYDTLQMLLRDILIEANKIAELMQDSMGGDAGIQSMVQNITTQSMRAATTMIVTIPIVCVYPFFQKYFIQGMSVGAVKG